TRPPVPSFRIPHSTLRTPIDAFIHRRLQDLGLTPAPRADRRTLIRRATFDLTGLPPTPEEIAAFLSDPAPHDAAFAKVVDRLLASPQYGEQYARHWLDVVRYADSAGFANDFERPNAWRYRDYVIRSFNADKPYDQFVMQQLAGDELNPHDPEMLIAVGFLRMGPWEQTGMSVAKVTRQQFLDDVISSVGKVFLSHPLECARCHDHKFDPIPTQDYYRIQAVFATTQFAGRDAPFLPDENTTGFARERGYLRQRIDRYQRILDEINTKQERAERAWYAERGLEYAPRQKKLRQDVPNDQIAPRDLGLTVEDMGLERIARKSLVRHTWELDRYEPIAFSVYSGKTPALRNVQSRLMMPDDPLASGTLELTAILSGGDPFSPTQPVTPGVLSALPGSNDVLHPTEWNTIPETVGGRRLEFARWVASAENPLTARSIVNRVWQWHFGQGLAGNANNFGAMGKKPTHPELLDWLACEFVGLQSAPPLRKGGLGGVARSNESGHNSGAIPPAPPSQGGEPTPHSALRTPHSWSLKRLHRLIMTSDAYCRAAAHPNREDVTAKDPDGTSYAVFQPRQLTAEELRDAMLAVSGELNPEMGGVPIRPEINREVAFQPRQIMGTYAPAYQPSPLPEDRHRRSIYALRLRGLRDPFMEVFGRPGP
ncbi:MAG: DUF1549 and DUF1553 domain-containing protein, partial [Planctomycetaceae bacterium]